MRIDWDHLQELEDRYEHERDVHSNRAAGPHLNDLSRLLSFGLDYYNETEMYRQKYGLIWLVHHPRLSALRAHLKKERPNVHN